MRTKLKNYSVSSILPRRVGSHPVNRRKRDDENELFYNLIQIDWILYSDIDAAPRLLLFSPVLPDKLQHKIQNLTLDQKSYVPDYSTQRVRSLCKRIHFLQVGSFSQK